LEAIELGIEASATVNWFVGEAERISDDRRWSERERERASEFERVGYFLPWLQGNGVGVKYGGFLGCCI
jgi:hypothetical protein